MTSVSFDGIYNGKEAEVGHGGVCPYTYIYMYIWVVVNFGVPFWVLIIIRHLIFRVPKRDHNFDNHPYSSI